MVRIYNAALYKAALYKVAFHLNIKYLRNTLTVPWLSLQSLSLTHFAAIDHYHSQVLQKALVYFYKHNPLPFYNI